MIRILIFLNIIVFLMWQFAGASSLPWLTQDFMADNFLVSWDSLVEGRTFTLLGSVFSHIDTFHILINMFVLANFGGILVRTLGRIRFLKFYLVAGVIASLAHAAVSNYIMLQPDLPALGASGAVAGCVMLFACLYPREKLLILGIIPMPAFFGALVFVGLDIWGLMAQAGGGGLPIGHGAHLGGTFTGLFYFLMLRRNFRRRQSLV